MICKNSLSDKLQQLRCVNAKNFEKRDACLQKIRDIEKKNPIPRYLLFEYKTNKRKLQKYNKKICDYENGISVQKITCNFVENQNRDNLKNISLKTNKCKSNKRKRYEKRISTVHDFEFTPIYILKVSECPVCEIEMMKENNMYICSSCGIKSHVIEDNTNNMAYSEDMDYSCFQYKRLNHFAEWIASFQGRENVNLDSEMLNSVCEGLFDMGIRNETDVNINNIRSVLKKLNLRKYYEHSTSIMLAITNNSAPKLHPSVQEQLKIMFLSIQESFRRHCPENRRNFLSYGYIIFKFFEILGLNQYTKFFSLLKGKDKLHRQVLFFFVFIFAYKN